MTKIISLAFVNLATPKAGAKHEPFVQQTGLSLLNKSACLPQSLGVTKFIMPWIQSHLVVLLTSDLDVQQNHLSRIKIEGNRGGFVEHLSPT